MRKLLVFCLIISISLCIVCYGTADNSTPPNIAVYVGEQNEYRHDDSSSLLDKFIVGALSSAIIAAPIFFWKSGVHSHTKCVIAGKVYYGFLYYRIALICLLGYFTALWIVGDSNYLIPILLSIPFSCVYFVIYRKVFTIMFLSLSNTDESSKKDGH